MNRNINTEVVIIGGGPSGYSAAFRCSDLGLNTILIEENNNLGGVCLNEGCIPSKALLHIAKVIKDAKKLSSTGVYFEKPKVDLDKVRLWKEGLVHKLSQGLCLLSNKKNITIIHGCGKFINDNNICVYTKDNNNININFK
ncbi:FAD-dependent oxidoreductase, partial [Buchnera aphidicola (Hormaphis cornu)]